MRAWRDIAALDAYEMRNHALMKLYVCASVRALEFGSRRLFARLGGDVARRSRLDGLAPATSEDPDILQTSFAYSVLLLCPFVNPWRY